MQDNARKHCRRPEGPIVVISIVLSQILAAHALLPSNAGVGFGLACQRARCSRQLAGAIAPRRFSGVLAGTRMQDRASQASGGGDIRTPAERINAMGQPMQVCGVCCVGGELVARSLLLAFTMWEALR